MAQPAGSAWEAKYGSPPPNFFAPGPARQASDSVTSRLSIVTNNSLAAPDSGADSPVAPGFALPVKGVHDALSGADSPVAPGFVLPVKGVHDAHIRPSPLSSSKSDSPVVTGFMRPLKHTHSEQAVLERLPALAAAAAVVHGPAVVEAVLSALAATTAASTPGYLAQVLAAVEGAPPALGDVDMEPADAYDPLLSPSVKMVLQSPVGRGQR